MKRYSIVISVSSFILLVVLFFISPDDFLKAFSIDFSMLIGFINFVQDTIINNYSLLLIPVILIITIIVVFSYGNIHTIAKVGGGEVE